MIERGGYTKFKDILKVGVAAAAVFGALSSPVNAEEDKLTKVYSIDCQSEEGKRNFFLVENFSEGKGEKIGLPFFERSLNLLDQGEGRIGIRPSPDTSPIDLGSGKTERFEDDQKAYEIFNVGRVKSDTVVVIEVICKPGIV